MGKEFIARWLALGRNAFDVNGHNDALRSKARCRLTHQIRVMNRGGVDTHFIGTGIQHGPDVRQSPDATTDRQRDKHFPGDLFNGVHRGVSPFVAGGNVEKRDLISPRFVVATRNLNRVTRVSYTNEVDAFNHSALINVQARNNAFRERHQSARRKASTSA